MLPADAEGEMAPPIPGRLIKDSLIAAMSRTGSVSVTSFTARSATMVVHSAGQARAMLEHDFRHIHDLQPKAELLVCGPPFAAARLKIDCSP
jgi:predicted ester cyclase